MVQFFEQLLVELDQSFKNQGASNEQNYMEHLLHPFYKCKLLEKFDLYGKTYDQLVQNDPRMNS